MEYAKLTQPTPSTLQWQNRDIFPKLLTPTHQTANWADLLGNAAMDTKPLNLGCLGGDLREALPTSDYTSEQKGSLRNDSQSFKNQHKNSSSFWENLLGCSCLWKQPITSCCSRSSKHLLGCLEWGTKSQLHIGSQWDPSYWLGDWMTWSASSPMVLSWHSLSTIAVVQPISLMSNHEQLEYETYANLVTFCVTHPALELWFFFLSLTWWQSEQLQLPTTGCPTQICSQDHPEIIRKDISSCPAPLPSGLLASSVFLRFSLGLASVLPSISTSAEGSLSDSRMGVIWAWHPHVAGVGASATKNSLAAMCLFFKGLRSPQVTGKRKRKCIEAIEAAVGAFRGNRIWGGHFKKRVRVPTGEKNESRLPSADLSKLPTEDVIQQGHLHGICPVLAANVEFPCCSRDSVCSCVFCFLRTRLGWEKGCAV